MKNRRHAIVIFSICVLTVSYCAFVLIFETLSARHAEADIREHGVIVADDLWNFNNAGAREYLKPAALNGHYSKISIISHNGEVFEELTTGVPSTLEKVGIRLHLVPQVKLLAPIEYDNYFIGWIEAIWLPQTLSTHLLVLGFMVMTLLIILLYAHIIEEKSLLEKHVKERTAELTDSNLKLKNEVRERAAAEAALLKSEKKYRHLTESIDDVIWVMDAELCCTYMSPVCTKIFGWQPGLLQQTNLEMLFSTVCFPSFQKVVAETLQNGYPTEHDRFSQGVELEMVHRDTGRLWCEIKFSCLQAPGEKIRQVMCVARNVTQRKAAQYEKEDLQEKLERSKKMESLGLLAGGVAHDLNNVLSGIVSYPELILLDLPQDSPIRPRIETIRDSGVKAAEIVQDLLALARRGVVSSAPVDINKLVAEYLHSPEYDTVLNYHSNVDVTFDMHEGLPKIIGSEVHLKKVIMNLISNAAEAIPSEKKGNIVIATKRCALETAFHGYQTIPPGDYVVLSVRDNGEGVAEEEIKRIFEPFFTKKIMGRSGSGLGLTVVWGAVEDHNGYLNLKSTINQGTTIDLYFPVTPESNGLDVEQNSSNQYFGKGERILIVDDQLNQREILTDILKRLNYRVHAVSDGQAAVLEVRQSPYELVILDMILTHGMDGLDTYTAIREIVPDQKVIIASGFAATERVQEAQRLGAGTYLQKPYSLENISTAIHQALSPPSG